MKRRGLNTEDDRNNGGQEIGKRETNAQREPYARPSWQVKLY